MGFWSKIFRRNEIQKANYEVGVGGNVNWYEDITPFSTYVRMGGIVGKIPMRRFSPRWLYDLAYTSDLLRTVIKTITDEAFKNGIEIKEKWMAKCPSCGREFMEDVDICPYDLTLTIKPNPKDKERLEEFLKTSNRFDEDMLTTCKIVDTDVNILDNGYIILRKEYEYDENGNIVSGRVKEMVRGAPEKMRLIISKYGMGRTDTGTYIYFCPIHRDRYTEVKGENIKPRCEICGGEMLKAWYMATTIKGAGNIYYGKEEVYHIKRWSNTSGYGVSPIIAVWMKVMTLLKMDRFILQSYSLQRSPKALLVLRGRLDNIRKSWEYLMQKARENPEMIYPLVIGGDETASGKRMMEYQEFNLKPAEMQWIETRAEFRDTVGVVFGVQPIFTSGKVGTGLQNEGLQITATTRTITETQRVWNKFFEWLLKNLGVNDYRLLLTVSEIEDELQKQEIEKNRLAIASQLQQFGYDIILKTDSRGLIDFTYEKAERKLENANKDENEENEEDEENGVS